MSKTNSTDANTDITVFVRAISTIQDGRSVHVAGSVFEVSPNEAARLIKAGAAERNTDKSAVPIEDELPTGMDPNIWMADPRAKTAGQRSGSFVNRAEFEAYLNRR
jgi:hypothetical protein